MLKDDTHRLKATNAAKSGSLLQEVKIKVNSGASKKLDVQRNPNDLLVDRVSRNCEMTEFTVRPDANQSVELLSPHRNSEASNPNI